MDASFTDCLCLVDFKMRYHLRNAWSGIFIQVRPHFLRAFPSIVAGYFLSRRSEEIYLSDNLYKTLIMPAERLFTHIVGIYKGELNWPQTQWCWSQVASLSFSYGIPWGWEITNYMTGCLYRKCWGLPCMFFRIILWTLIKIRTSIKVTLITFQSSVLSCMLV